MREGGEWVQGRGELREGNSMRNSSRLCYTGIVLHCAYAESQAECDSGCRGEFTPGGEESCTQSKDQRESTGTGVPGGAGGGTWPKAASRSTAQTGVRDGSR